MKDKEIKYIEDKGMDKIKEHAYEFINKRIAPGIIANDGKQTPMRGHPVFIAQHATATCCRDCLYKWHHIEKNRELSNDEIDHVVFVIMTWIDVQVKLYKDNV